MTGVCIEVSDPPVFVATDSYRMACNGIHTDVEQFIIPSAAIELITKTFDICEIGFGKQYFIATDNETTLLGRIINEKFPPWDNIYSPDNARNVLLTTKHEFHNKLLSAIQYANEETRRVTLCLGDEVIIKTGDVNTGTHAELKLRRGILRRGYESRV